MLSLRALSKSYGPRRVFEAVSLDLQPGDYVAIMGESGSGKSSLLNIVAGLDEPDAGAVLVNGTDLSALDDTRRTRLRRDLMGFVFQAFHLLPHLTIAENVALPLQLAGIAREAVAERLAALLASVGLADMAGRYPREISGGEMQRAAIARALIHRPALLLADEPTGNLDARNAQDVLLLLREQVKAGGGAGILVTHSRLAAATADRVYVLGADGLQPGNA